VWGAGGVCVNTVGAGGGWGGGGGGVRACVGGVFSKVCKLILPTSPPQTPKEDLNYICSHILSTIRFYHNDLLLYLILLS